MSRSPQEELVHFLSDLYSMELQAIAQLVTAPKMAEDPGFASDFQIHLEETERQAEMVRKRLEELGGAPSVIKDTIMKLGGKSFLLFARLQLETPGRLLAHSYSYEAMEWAGYGVLIRMAEMAGDSTSADLGRAIQAEERAMMERLEQRFDAIENLSHQELSAEEMDHHLRKHLAEAHALEVQSIKLLEKAEGIAGDPILAGIFSAHLEESRRQAGGLESRLHALGAGDPVFQDAALKLGALEWGLFFQAQKDSPAKLLAFAYAVEHLEIASYELLLRTARRCGDNATSRICERILGEERAMAGRLAEHFDLAVEATFAALRA